MLILLSEVAQGYGPAVYLAPEGRWAAVVLPLRRGNLSAQDTNGPGARRSDLPRTTTENELGWSRVRPARSPATMLIATAWLRATTGLSSSRSRTP